MNHSLNIFLISDDVQMVAAVFDDNAHKVYHFKTVLRDLKPGDSIVVEHTHGYGLVKVKAVDVPVEFEAAHDYKWVICKVDFEAHEALKEREKVLIDEVRRLEKMNKRDQLRAALGITTNVSLLGAPLADPAPRRRRSKGNADA